MTKFRIKFTCVHSKTSRKIQDIKDFRQLFCHPATRETVSLIFAKNFIEALYAAENDILFLDVSLEQLGLFSFNRSELYPEGFLIGNIVCIQPPVGDVWDMEESD